MSRQRLNRTQLAELEASNQIKRVDQEFAELQRQFPDAIVETQDRAAAVVVPTPPECSKVKAIFITKGRGTSRAWWVKTPEGERTPHATLQSVVREVRRVYNRYARLA